ncbi:leucine-rich repeat domain-containing protein [Echinicola salinicaeni]|uniref:leucine-rich repeat domain-containing protein n=1 Tax=Echinicola salinicaeni TaxID=2762757 RepID=UPI0016446282|nr:leucine-rich repeat domain-containing protein [Echinicola salinicaeni]
MRNKIVWTGMIFLIFTSPAFSQRTVLGKILDEKTKEPINGVTILLDKSGITTTSNHRGYFQFNIDSSRFFIFKKLGYLDAELEIPDQNRFQVYLKPLKPDPPKIRYSEGLAAYHQHLSKNLRYPEEARRKGIEGLFRASVEINRKGHINDVEIINTEGDLGGIDKEIKRFLFSLPGSWSPSDSAYNIIMPFRFRLGGSNNNFHGNIEGAIDLNALAEVVIRSHAGEIQSGLNSPSIVAKDVAFSLRKANSNSNTTKLVLKNKSLDDFKYLSKTLPHVKYLDVERSGLIDLPKQLEFLPMLEEFYAPYNRLSSLPSGFSKLKKLKKIGLGDNRFEQFPEELYELDQLEVLDFGKNNIEYIGEEISRMKNLKVLILSKNKLRSLPSSIMKMKNLEVLNIKGNKISKVEIEELKGALYGVAIIY